ncbi:hypothetical protein EJ05DRAFT_307289 [Pseudovirgaria hyperparasitica]|uniref:Uncharacterized protein n=1 Tax=Pseudovirgaria hyperparasitica TaxID=470096 RepID=A0A6A6WA31_9PEZI|nr:uncharacterized protein EJ05DRAFT_307289 [Pseudovirgaria hyperparasitica]KAF2759718.1 hypothetical protein EJ05DRAFT_307289 [Pseudovirgaria hyperparasitica]
MKLSNNLAANIVPLSDVRESCTKPHDLYTFCYRRWLRPRKTWPCRRRFWPAVSPVPASTSLPLSLSFPLLKPRIVGHVARTPWLLWLYASQIDLFREWSCSVLAQSKALVTCVAASPWQNQLHIYSVSFYKTYYHASSGKQEKHVPNENIGKRWSTQDEEAGFKLHIKCRCTHSWGVCCSGTKAGI